MLPFADMESCLTPFSDLHDASVTEDRTNIYMDVNGNNFTIKDVKL